jgi:4-alpha-glucanotransferase
MAKTPSPLVGVALDDITGQVEPVNIPGLGQDRYPSWSRRMTVSLEELPSHPDVSLALRGLRSRVRMRVVRD